MPTLLTLSASLRLSVAWTLLFSGSVRVTVAGKVTASAFVFPYSTLVTLTAAKPGVASRVRAVRFRVAVTLFQFLLEMVRVTLPVALSAASAVV